MLNNVENKRPFDIFELCWWCAACHKPQVTYHTPHAQHRDQIMQAISFSWNWKEIASHVVAAAIFKAAKLTTNNLLLFFISFLPSYAKVTQIANLCRSVCSLRASIGMYCAVSVRGKLDTKRLLRCVGKGGWVKPFWELNFWWFGDVCWGLRQCRFALYLFFFY